MYLSCWLLGVLCEAVRVLLPSPLRPASASREQIHSLAVLICQGQMLEVDHDRASRLSALRSALAEAAVGTRLS